MGEITSQWKLISLSTVVSCFNYQFDTGGEPNSLYSVIVIINVDSFPCQQGGRRRGGGIASKLSLLPPAREQEVAVTLMRWNCGRDSQITQFQVHINPARAVRQLRLEYIIILYSNLLATSLHSHLQRNIVKLADLNASHDLFHSCLRYKVFFCIVIDSCHH